MSAGEVLVVDDIAANRDLLREVLSLDGYRIKTAATGEEGLAAIEECAPDVILLDIMLPGIDGFDVCQRLKGNPKTRLIPVVLVTSLHEREDKIRGINAGADDFLSKPVNAHELRARVRSLTRLKRFTDELDRADSVILSLGLTIEARDPYTGDHCHRLAVQATALGVHLDLPDEDLAALHRGGYLHDLGKVGVPDALLAKPGRLTDEEFALVKEHTTIGDRLCGELRALAKVRSIVRHHHERIDGTGYPDRLSGADVPLLAQIVGIVDIYDALTSDRPYRSAMSATDACRVLREEAERGWRNRDLVETFIGLAQSDAFQRLSTTVPSYPMSFSVAAAR